MRTPVQATGVQIVPLCNTRLTHSKEKQGDSKDNKKLRFVPRRRGVEVEMWLALAKLSAYKAGGSSAVFHFNVATRELGVDQKA